MVEMKGMMRPPGKTMGERERDKGMVRVAITASSMFGEEVSLGEAEHMIRTVYKGKKFNKKYLSELREEVLAERAMLVERLSTPEGAMELAQEWGLL
jgi:hypothetical protein